MRGKYLLLTALLLVAACSGGGGGSGEQPPPPPGGGDQTGNGFNLSLASQTQDDGFANRDFSKAEISCQALDSGQLSADQVPGMACRCFLTKLFRVIEADSTKQLQQGICGGATTVDKLFGPSGYYSKLDAMKNGGPAPSIKDFIPCDDINVADASDFSKMIYNLNQNNANFDSLKPNIVKLGVDLNMILPILDKTLVENASCTIPKQFLSMDKDMVLKLGDLNDLAGNLKLLVALTQISSQYEYNFDPQQDVQRAIIKTPDGGRNDLGLQALPEFIVADALKGTDPITKVVTSFENSPLIVKLITTFDPPKPFGRLAEGTQFTSLQPQLEAVLNHLIAAAQKPHSDSGLFPPSQTRPEFYEELKKSLADANYWSSYSDRIKINLQKMLLAPPSIDRLHFDRFPSVLDSLKTPNFLKLGMKNKEIGTQTKFSCVMPGARIAFEVHSCAPADGCGADGICSQKDEPSIGCQKDQRGTCGQFGKQICVNQ